MEKHFTLHPNDGALLGDFQYGDMLVRRMPLVDNAKNARKLESIFNAYKNAGIFPAGTSLIGDYLEHTLIKQGGKGYEKAGRYLGIVLPKGDYQYLRVEGESIGVKKDKLETLDVINILTDICLFGSSCAAAVLENGAKVSLVSPKSRITSRVKELQISENLCFYEIDSIVRLTDLICALIEGNGRFKKLTLAMPTIEYYFYLMEAYNKGIMSVELMQQWISTIDRQAERLAHAFRKRINFNAGTCQPFSILEHYVKNWVNTGAKVNFETVINILSESDNLWAEVLSITKPTDWESLNYANYVMAALMTASIKTGENKLTVYVENPSEQRILRNAAQIAKKLEKLGSRHSFGMVGIYAHEKIFISNSTTNKKVFPRLYYLEDNRLAAAKYIRDIILANRQKII